MKILKNKKAINTKMWITAIVGAIVLFLVMASLMPEVQTAGDSMNATNTCTAQGGYWNHTGTSTYECQNESGYPGTRLDGYTGSLPLASLFGSSGVAVLIIMVSIFIVVVYYWLKKKH